MFRFFCCCSKDAEKPEKNTVKKPEEIKTEAFFEEDIIQLEKDNINLILEDKLKNDPDYAVKQANESFFEMNEKCQMITSHTIWAAEKIHKLLDPKVALAVTKMKDKIKELQNMMPSQVHINTENTVFRNRSNCRVGR